MASTGERDGVDAYAAIAYRHLRLIALSVVLCIALSLASSMTRSPRFQATANVQLDGLVPEAKRKRDDQKKAAVRTEEAVIRSQLASSAIRERLGSVPDFDVIGDRTAMEIRITAASDDRDEAVRRANGVAQGYVDARNQVRRDDLTEAIRTVQTQLDQAKTRLGELNAEIRTVEDSSGGDSGEVAQVLDSQGAERTAVDARIRRFSTKLADLRTVLTRDPLGRAVIRARPPTAPVSPRPVRDTGTSALLGLVLGGSLAFVRDWRHRRVTSAARLHQWLPLITVLGEVPARLRRAAPVRSTILDPPSPDQAEAYARLVANLGFADVERPRRVIQLTSAERGEGTTTATLRLASQLARSSRRVLLVEADCRRPHLGRDLALADDVGLITTLLGETTVAEAAVAVGDTGHLWVLPSGPPVAGSADLLASSRFADLIRYVAGEFDYVLIDTPPVLGAPDALALAGLVDGTILVIKAPDARIDQTRAALDELGRVNSPVVGAVVVNVATRRRRRRRDQLTEPVKRRLARSAAS